MPLTPGSLTSSTIQLGTLGRFSCKNSDVEAKTRACNPTDRSRLETDAPSEASSSMTKTIDWPEVACFIRSPARGDGRTSLNAASYRLPGAAVNRPSLPGIENRRKAPYWFIHRQADVTGRSAMGMVNRNSVPQGVPGAAQ